MKYSKWVGVAAIAVAGVMMAASYAPVEETADAKPVPATHKAPPADALRADGTIVGWSKPPLMPPSMRPADYKP